MTILHLATRVGIVLTIVEALVFGSTFLFVGSIIFEGRGVGVGSLAVNVLLPTGLLLLCLLIAGGYRTEAWRSPRTMAKRMLGGGIGGAIVIVLLHDMFIGDGKTAIEIVGATLLGCILAIGGRLVGRMVVGGQLKRRVLVLGTGERAASLKQCLVETPMVGIYLTGFLPLARPIFPCSTMPASRTSTSWFSPSMTRSARRCARLSWPAG